MKGDFQQLLEATARALNAEIRPGVIGDGEGVTRLRVPVPGERAQTVKVVLDEDTIRFTTRCGEAVIARENPSLHRALLVKNASLKHGFFAIGADGGIELVGTQLASTCDVEEFTTLLANIAVVGDYLEQQLAEGLPGGELDLY
ncbi:MAG: hypothetical protein ACYTGX_11195 [Planctomycetota bacterium]|jgi:hypothetical protein